MSREALALLKVLALRDRVNREHSGSRNAVVRRLDARMTAALNDVTAKIRHNDLPATLFINQVAYPVLSATKLMADALDKADRQEAAE